MRLIIGHCARLLVAVLALSAGVVSAQTLYGALATTATTSNLYTINPANGAQVLNIGPIGYAVTGLAVHPATGVLYGSTSNNSTACPGCLITINKATGAGTVVGSFGFTGQTMADLTFTSDGTLYGWLEASADDLFSINLATGAATVVGDSGLSTFGSGLAADAANVIYYSGDGNDGPLRTVNRTTGAVTTVATLSGGTSPAGSPVAALAFNAGVLYGVVIDFSLGTRPTRLVTINTATGVITDLGPSIDRLDAIIFDGATPPPPPAPSQPIPVDSPLALALLALLLAAGSAWMVRRRR